ncbi:hypothetical protein EDC94DRAFT_67278 [Helicostylum pulchrum]|nr:hypothetical protein EDC94DRAFT_67278 [Helicostylum pulchrum]
MDTTTEIIKNLKRQNISRLDAQIDLLQLARKSQPIDSKIIRSVAGLVDKLPRQEFKDVIKETEFNHRYVDTFLSHLFDDPGEGVLFRWTSVTNTKTGAIKSGSISRNRPDSCISELDGLYFDASLGFVEVKPNSEGENKQAVSKDLIRLGMFSKNAKDKWLTRGCLSIQVVGYEATFYITTQPSSELYTMFELCTIHISSCLSDLPSYITQFDEVAAILRCYENCCIHLPFEAQRRGKKRATLSYEAFDTIAMSPKSNKRRCYTIH